MGLFIFISANKNTVITDSESNDLESILNKMDSCYQINNKTTLYKISENYIHKAELENDYNLVLDLLEWKIFYTLKLNDYPEYKASIQQNIDLANKFIKLGIQDSNLIKSKLNAQYHQNHFYFKIGKFQKSLTGMKLLLEELNQYNQYSFNELESQINQYLGFLNKQLGFNQLAETYLNKHLDIVLKSGRSPTMAYYQLSDLYKKMNQSNKAIHYINLAKKSLENDVGYEFYEGRFYSIHNDIISLLIKENKFHEAIKIGDEIATNNNANKQIHNDLLLQNIGIAMYKVGMLKHALKKFNQTLVISKNSFSSQKEYILISKSNYYIGEICLLYGDTSNANKSFSRSIYILEEAKKNGIDTLEISYFNIYISSLTGLMKVSSNENYPKIINQILTKLDDSRFFFTDEYDRYLLIANQYETIETCLNFLSKKNYPDFNLSHQLIERSKSLTLLEAYNQAKVDNKASINNPEIEEERKLLAEQKISSINIRELNENPNPNRYFLNQLSDRYIEITEKIDSVRKIIKTYYPDYYALKNKIEIVDLIDIQKSLPKEKAIIQYIVGKEHLYAFFIHRDTIVFHRSDIALNQLDNLINNLSNELLYQLNSHGSKSYAESFSQFTKSSKNLFNVLIKNVIPENLSLSHLIIGPDGVLNNVPFEILISDSVSVQSSYKNLPYLIKDINISYTFSSTLYNKMKENKKDKKGNLLAFAPDFKMDINAPHYLSPIPSNKEEVEKISRLTGSKIYKGKKANKENFAKQAGKYNIIHLATHGFSDNEMTQNSYISFSQYGNEINENEKLYLRDLYSYPLNAEMIVLSACETNLGKYSRSEGVASIARAFAYAGCNSIVTSLWKVNQKSTAELMKSYYVHLREGLDKSEALRQAKLELMQKSSVESHPYYWAGFVVLGNEEEITLKKPFNRKWILLLLSLMLITGASLHYKKIRRAARKATLP